MSGDIVLFLELIGTVAFSVSGAITGLKKKMDIRSVRFVPHISTTSKVFVDKKRKNKSRSNLKKQLKEEEV